MKKQDLVSARCETCRYFWKVGTAPGNYGCEYILHTEKMRPCPPGEDCTVYSEQRDPRQPQPLRVVGPYRWTESRLKFAFELLASGMTYREAAEKMGTTRDSVKNAVRRARGKEADNGATDLL